jgi:hypothetical protein
VWAVVEQPNGDIYKMLLTKEQREDVMERAAVLIANETIRNLNNGNRGLPRADDDPVRI